MTQIQNTTHNTDNRPLSPETLMAEGWKCVNQFPYKFRKEGNLFNELRYDVLFVTFARGKVSVYYHDDIEDNNVDIRQNRHITVGEFNQLLDIVGLQKFKI